jgi:hypothetical protein
LLQGLLQSLLPVCACVLPPSFSLLPVGLRRRRRPRKDYNRLTDPGEIDILPADPAREIQLDRAVDRRRR